MTNEPWELVENPTKYDDYNWYSDDVPARKFYLFIAELGHRLRHLMTDAGPIQMIQLCEQCAEGRLTEAELGDLSDKHRPGVTCDYSAHVANNLYWMVADRYKVYTRCVHYAADAFAFQAAVDAKIISPQAEFEALELLREHPLFTGIRARTELEWGALVRDIYGRNPFPHVTFEPAWRTSTAVALAQQMYDARDFGAMPILADALQDAGCENEDVLNHCRDEKQTHVRGCWVVDLVLENS